LGARADKLLGGSGPVPDYFVPSIVTTLCCCLPAGIGGIVFSTRARSARDAGNIPAALAAAAQARTLVLVGIVLGLVVNTIVFLSMVAGGG
jgi:hypothetical protein